MVKNEPIYLNIIYNLLIPINANMLLFDISLPESIGPELL